MERIVSDEVNGLLDHDQYLGYVDFVIASSACINRAFVYAHNVHSMTYQDRLPL